MKHWQVQRPFIPVTENGWRTPDHSVLMCTEIIDGTIFYNQQFLLDVEIEAGGWKLLALIVEAMEAEWERNMALGRR